MKGKLFDNSHIKEKEQEKKFENLFAEIEKLKELHLSKAKTGNKKDEISIAVQLLIFHYLGLLNEIDLPNTDKAILLAVIFRAEGAENIRKNLSNVGGKNSALLKVENLEFVCNVFERVGLKEPLKKAQLDLQNLLSKR